MRVIIPVISAITILLLSGCSDSSNTDMVSVNFNDLTGNPSTQELKIAESCLSTYASKLEKDLRAGMEPAGYKVDIFSISAHKVFTNSEGAVTAQYSLSGMQVLPSGKEQLMDDKKEIINCSIYS
ncbi:hypothetical protein [Moritella marina]|uniref:hypothetical protein n=1 Tax=Moritella marina TaxID=90736 RepID=UPI003703F046